MRSFTVIGKQSVSKRALFKGFFRYKNQSKCKTKATAKIEDGAYEKTNRLETEEPVTPPTSSVRGRTQQSAFRAKRKNRTSELGSRKK